MDLLYNIPEQPNAVHHGHELDQIDERDSLYTELERQIILLINAADENDDSKDSFKHLRPRKSSSKYSFPQPDQSYFDWTVSENSNSVPTWILNLWRSNGNGTGVFIPHIVKNRRKNQPLREGRTTRKEEKIYKAVANKS